MLFFEESAASFFEMAVDHILGFDLITERERTLVSAFYVDDVELREDLLESARRMGGTRRLEVAALLLHTRPWLCCPNLKFPCSIYP